MAAVELARQRPKDLGARGRGPNATMANPGGLTDRQLAVLALLREGMTNAEIGGWRFEFWGFILAQ